MEDEFDFRLVHQQPQLVALHFTRQSFAEGDYHNPFKVFAHRVTEFDQGISRTVRMQDMELVAGV